jgi:hypothetical protein
VLSSGAAPPRCGRPARARRRRVRATAAPARPQRKWLLDPQAALFEQVVKNAPGERTVRAAALLRERDAKPAIGGGEFAVRAAA